MLRLNVVKNSLQRSRDLNTSFFAGSGIRNLQRSFINCRQHQSTQFVHRSTFYYVSNTIHEIQLTTPVALRTRVYTNSEPISLSRRILLCQHSAFVICML